MSKQQRVRWRVVAEGFEPNGRSLYEVSMWATRSEAVREADNYWDRDDYRMKNVTVSTVIDYVEEAETEMTWQQKKAHIEDLCGRVALIEIIPKPGVIALLPCVEIAKDGFLTTFVGEGMTLSEAYDDLWAKMIGLTAASAPVLRVWSPAHKNDGKRFRWNGETWKEVYV